MLDKDLIKKMERGGTELPSTSVRVRRKTNSSEEGVKHDENKIRLELIPSELNIAVGTILTFGAKKYSDRNWEKGMDWGRVYGALQRHLNAWWSGEKKDSETGKSHLWHAACCITFLITYELRGIGHDSRPSSK